jgi:hypothetical protein
MAEKLNLNRYKSSGVYTVEIDESINLSLPNSTGRLVIGSSKKGPINSVVVINDTKALSAVYGEIDTKLEKNGSYFHRTIDVALRQGPVYALNILPVTDTDIAYFTTFNTESASNNATWTSSAYHDSISHFYNTQKLWFADADQLSKYKNLKLGDTFPASGTVTRDSNKLISLVNLSKKQVTVWARIADTNGYDITVKDYYKLLGEKVEIPEYLHPDDYMADYFIEVIAVEGNWTDYRRLAKDPVYRQYFDETGLKLGQLTNFTSLREVTLVNRTIGSIIPDFTDLTGAVASIDTLFNRSFSQSGLFLSLDHKKIDMIDLTNATFASGTSTEPVSEQRLDLVGYGVDEMDLATYGVDDGTSLQNAVALIDVLSHRKPIASDYYFKLTSTSYSSTYANGETYIVNGGGNKYIVATYGSKLYSAWASGFVKTGDKINWIDPVSSAQVNKYISTNGVVNIQSTGQIKYIEFFVYSDATFTNQADAYYTTDGGFHYLHIIQATENLFKYEFDLTDSTRFITSSPYNFKYSSPNQLVVTLDPTLYGNPAKKERPNPGFTYNSDSRADIDNFFKTGQYVKAKITTDLNGDPVIRERFLKIKSISAVKVSVPSIGPDSLPATTLQYTIKVDGYTDSNIRGIDLTDSKLTCYKGIKNFVTNLHGFYVPAMIVDETAMYPNGTSQRQDDILSYMYDNTNIAATVADNETLDFRYIIDSYEGQISHASKQYLVQLAADHGKAFAILNSPSFAQYERSSDPGFIDINTNLVSTEYISTGGNLLSNPSFTFGFASGDKNGIPISTYAGYFMPNLIIYENGKNKSIPPATYVANTYMKKYSNGNTFSIVAGKRGIITEPEITGVEYDLTNDDRDFLEPAGFNLIVRRRGFGVMIFSNNTGYQTVKSALNNIHVREALVTIERDVERILLNYLFEFNDPTTRLRVKTLIKNYLTAVQDANGITTFDIVFDDSNNGVTVLENNAGVVDIIVNFPRGIQKFINRITITRANGQLSSQSTGFTPSF